MKKVYFLINTLKMAGAQKSAWNWYNYFKKSTNFKAKFVLFDSQIDFNLKDEYICLNVPASNNIFKKLSIILKRVNRLKKIIKQEKPDYVISFMENANFVNLFQTSIKSIITTHSFISKKLKNMNKIIGFVYKILIKILYNKAYYILTVSTKLKEDLINNFNIHADRIKVIYNPIIPEELASMSKEKIHEKKIQKKHYIINVGRLVNDKDHITLLESYNSLEKTLKNKYKLVIIGEGPLKPALNQFIINNNLEKNVLLLGYKKNPYNYMANAKLFVLSSKIEGFAIVIVESLFLGVPVISFDILAGPEEILCKNNGRIIENNIKVCDYGCLVLDRDKKALANAIRLSLTSSKFYNNLKSNIKERAKTFYINNIGEKLTKLVN